MAAIMDKKVFVTRRITDRALDYLRGHVTLSLNPHDRALTPEELHQGIKGMDAVLTMLTDKVDDAFLDAAGSQCRIVANFAVGYNNLDIAAATARGIYLSNTPDVLTNATADLAWALLLGAARRVVEGDRLTRPGRFPSWGPLFMLGTEVSGKTVGVVGAGRIGRAFARRAVGFEMNILYSGSAPKPEFEKDTGARFVSFETLLRESDFISIHTPLTPGTRHMFSEKEFSMMKKGAIIVNTARGPVIDEKALAKALADNVIGGAGLDVFENEPDVDSGLLGLDNLVMTPHVGSATLETRDNMGLMAANNILAVLRGEMPPQCLNPEAASNRK